MLCCLYEDRIAQIPGLKLLLLSLQQYCPGWAVQLHFPHAPDSLRNWLNARNRVTLSEASVTGGSSYNVKPEVLLSGIRTGAPVCLWLDTDLLVNGSLDFLHSWPSEELIVAADPWEYPCGSTNRAAAWGLTPGRDFPGPVNSCLVRVSAQHVDLLRDWSSLVRRPDYTAGQQKRAEHRNAQMLSDQDALSALIASEKFAALRVRRITHGTQILQHHGAGAFGPKERLMVMRHGDPPLLHAMGSVKPWLMPADPSPFQNPRGYYERVYLELSPYVCAARKYRRSLSEKDLTWLDLRTGVGKLGMALFGESTSLRGCIQATVHRSIWAFRKHVGVLLALRAPRRPRGTKTAPE